MRADIWAAYLGSDEGERQADPLTNPRNPRTHANKRVPSSAMIGVQECVGPFETGSRMQNLPLSMARSPGRVIKCCIAATVAAVLLFIGAARSEASGPADDAAAAKPSQAAQSAANNRSESFADRVNRIMRLRASQLVTMNVPDLAAVEQPLSIAAPIDGRTYTMNLQPHSVRAANYQLRAQIADGSIIAVDPGPDRMFNGSLAEAAGSQVAGGLLDDGLHALVRLPDGQEYWVEPLLGRVAGARADQYVTYRSQDIIHPEGICGVDDAFINAHPGPMIDPAAQSQGGIAGSTIYCTELACDADVEYYQSQGSSVTNVQNRINLVINTMNLQYINQVDIQFVITNILVRTAEPDPYTTTESGTLLSQLANEWNANQTAIPRDIVQLFTAKNIDSTVIGISYLGTICNTGSAYSLVQSDCCGGLGCATDLSAHELGHSWNAGHCTATCNSTMNASIQCVNTFLNSSPDSVAAIVAFRNTRTCLSQCADATLPFNDTFPSTTIDAAKWTTIVGVTSNTLGTNEPSAPNSLDLKGRTGGGTQIRSSRINSAGLVNFQMAFKYERKGGGDQPETGDDLVVEYFNNAGNWIEINRQPGNGAAMTTYLPVTVIFPADALHSEFRVRFRNLSTQNNLDDWFVDDVSITGQIPPSNNSCSTATVASTGNTPFTTMGASTDGPDEPSGCGFASPTQIANDVWFKWISSCTGQATFSLCGSNFDSRLATYIGCPTVPGQFFGCNDNFCGSSPQVTINVTAGTLYRIRVGGANGATGTGTLAISCVPSAPLCPADVNHSGAVNIDDLLGVINAWGPCAGCAADITNNGVVNIDDLLGVINAWGACP
jgi:hypothetical protein